MGKKNPLELPYRWQFSLFDDIKFTLGGLLILLLPLVLIGAIIVFALSWR